MKNRDILNKLNSKQKKQFITNCKRNYKELYYSFMNRRAVSYDNILFGSFSWYNTPQGNEYWKEICNKLSADEPYNY